VTAVLEARGLDAGYGSYPVIREVDLVVRPGEVIALLGRNGAGKTTTLLALSGELSPLAGQVLLDGAPTRSPLYRRARGGLAFLTEDQSVFRTLSTRDNLRVARAEVAGALELFPELEKRLDVRAGLLSGGEQKMLSLAMALGREPRLLLADELSLGLGPLVVRRLLETVRAVADERGTGVVLVEQHVRMALRYADRACVMGQGRIELEGGAEDLRTRIAEIEERYLGGPAAAGAAGS
jgi:branched-chain amino acid transport system ATP-binding protein